MSIVQWHHIKRAPWRIYIFRWESFEPAPATLHSRRGQLHALITICEDANNHYPAVSVDSEAQIQYVKAHVNSSHALINAPDVTRQAALT